MLIEWISSDKNNLKSFREMGRIWLMSGVSAGERRFDSSKAWNETEKKISDNEIRPFAGKTITLRLKSLLQYAAAAVIILMIGVTSLFLFRGNSDVSTVELLEASAPKGSRSIITLADGSSVWLNSGTKITYRPDFGQNNRELHLEGEAYFVVAENKKMPFKVNTSDILITALGTAFNVKAYSDESVIETTLESGEVRIDHINSGDKKAVADPVYLKPNQKAVFNRTNDNLAIDGGNITAPERKKIERAPVREIPIVIDTLVDTKLSTSWKDSRWIFRKEKLSRMKPILERRYDISIVFRDTSLASYKFTGTIKEESLDQVLKAVILAAPIKYSINDNIITLYEDPDQKDKYIKNQKNIN
jgi:ferric-dicitrate binding protein FerR (iron transport regulator)